MAAQWYIFICTSPETVYTVFRLVLNTYNSQYKKRWFLFTLFKLLNYFDRQTNINNNIIRHIRNNYVL